MFLAKSFRVLSSKHIQLADHSQYTICSEEFSKSFLLSGNELEKRCKFQKPLCYRTIHHGTYLEPDQPR